MRILFCKRFQKYVHQSPAITCCDNRWPSLVNWFGLPTVSHLITCYLYGNLDPNSLLIYKSALLNIENQTSHMNMMSSYHNYSILISDYPIPDRSGINQHRSNQSYAKESASQCRISKKFCSLLLINLLHSFVHWPWIRYISSVSSLCSPVVPTRSTGSAHHHWTTTQKVSCFIERPQPDMRWRFN